MLTDVVIFTAAKNIAEVDNSEPMDLSTSNPCPSTIEDVEGDNISKPLKIEQEPKIKVEKIDETDLQMSIAAKDPDAHTDNKQSPHADSDSDSDVEADCLPTPKRSPAPVVGPIPGIKSSQVRCIVSVMILSAVTTHILPFQSNLILEII